MKRISQIFTVSDGLLPLLDVTLLLLGLFMIILGVVASDAANSGESSNSATMTLPSGVALLRIASDQSIFLSDRKISQERLDERLRDLLVKDGKTVVLLQVDNVWDPESSEMLEKCRKEIQNIGLHYARVY